MIGSAVSEPPPFTSGLPSLSFALMSCIIPSNRPSIVKRGIASIEVSNSPSPQPTLTVDGDAKCADDQNEAPYTFDAGAGFTSYDWNFGGTTQTITYTVTGGTGPVNFYVTVTDANGCTGTDSTEVTFYNQPLIIPSTTYQDCSNNSAIIDAGATSFLGTESQDYQWSTGATTQTLATSAAGIYTVTVTTVNNCDYSTTRDVCG